MKYLLLAFLTLLPGAAFAQGVTSAGNAVQSTSTESVCNVAAMPGADPSGSTSADNSIPINACAALKPDGTHYTTVYLQSGVYYVKHQINLANGQCMIGPDGRNLATVEFGPDFDASAPGVVVMTGTEQNAPCVRHMTFTALQPASLTATAVPQSVITGNATFVGSQMTIASTSGVITNGLYVVNGAVRLGVTVSSQASGPAGGDGVYNLSATVGTIASPVAVVLSTNTISVVSGAGIAVGDHVVDSTLANLRTKGLGTTVTAVSGNDLTLSQPIAAALGADTLYFGVPRASWVTLADGCSVTAGAAPCKYPWVIYLNGTNRAVIDDIKVNGAWDGISATNGGGIQISRVEMGSVDIGLLLDGAKDFVTTLRGWHQWNFGMPDKGYTFGTVSDGSNQAIELGRIDGMTAGDITLESSNLVLTSNAPNSVDGWNISGLVLDGGKISIPSTGSPRVNFVNVIVENNPDGIPPVQILGGKSSFVNMRAAINDNTACAVQITNATVEISNSYIEQDALNTSALCVAGGAIIQVMNTRLDKAPALFTVPVLQETGTSAQIELIGDKFTGGSGPAMSIVDNASNIIQANATNGTVTFPTLPLGPLGTYFGNSNGFAPSFFNTPGTSGTYYVPAGFNHVKVSVCGAGGPAGGGGVGFASSTISGASGGGAANCDEKTYSTTDLNLNNKIGWSLGNLGVPGAPVTAATATASASFATSVMTITGTPAITIGPGTYVSGANLGAAGTTVISDGSGVGAAGTYNLSTTPGTVTTETVNVANVTSAGSGNASFATNVMTVTGNPTVTIGLGTFISASGVAAGTYVTSLGTGTGSAGTYNLSTSPGTIASEAIVIAPSVPSGNHGQKPATGQGSVISTGGFALMTLFVGGSGEGGLLAAGTVGGGPAGVCSAGTDGVSGGAATCGNTLAGGNVATPTASYYFGLGPGGTGSNAIGTSHPAAAAYGSFDAAGGASGGGVNGTTGTSGGIGGVNASNLTAAVAGTVGNINGQSSGTAANTPTNVPGSGPAGGYGGQIATAGTGGSGSAGDGGAGGGSCVPLSAGASCTSGGGGTGGAPFVSFVPLP